MKPICDILKGRLTAVINAVTGQTNAPALVKPAQNPRFGDYQANGVMALAQKIGQNPRDLARQIVAQLDVSDMCDEPEVAGAGFINFRLKPAWLAERLTEASRDRQRLGINPVENPPVTVVDFSSPNLAKEMHVGHLRSTIIGDVIARVLEFWYGDENKPHDHPDKKIIRQNHVGDWGTQFGMLLNYLEERNFPPRQEESALNEAAGVKFLDFDISDLEEFYRQAKERFDKERDFAQKSREWVVKLQTGDGWARVYWINYVQISLQHCQDIYDTLGVKLTRADVRGESFYNNKLASVLSELWGANLLQESEGAQCVFLEGFRTKEGNPLPLIVQKSDGAYLYATTDLAAIRFRVDELKAKRIIYVTDARQKLHFEMVFTCARQAGWAQEEVMLEHVPFGSVLGDDHRPFKTRAGENVKLKALLDEAEARARRIVEEKNPGLPEEQKQKIARAVGIGAVKYADLSNNLVSDYVFDWDKMLAMEGNTAPYMQYAYARVQSIFRKGEVEPEQLLQQEQGLELTQPQELNLAKLLLRYGETVEMVSRDLRPHLLTSYLFDLAQSFSVFYTNCPVLKAERRTRTSRLLLCYQTAQTIRHGLGLLGIETVEQM